MSLHQKSKVSRNDTPTSPLPSPTLAPANKPGGRRLLWRWLWQGVIVVLGLIMLALIGLYVSQPRYYKVLIIGSDQRNTEHARSDVLMLLAIPKSSKDQFSMIMIPRDTKIDHPQKGLQKITHFYALWDDPKEYLGNHNLTEAVVEQLLNININATVEITFTSFDEIVDLLGGVDTAQGHLTGAQAEELVHNRYVQPNGDFGRAAEQREILRNLLPKLKNLSNAQTLYRYFSQTNRARLTIQPFETALFGIAYLIGHRNNPSLGSPEEVVLPGSGQKIYTPAFGKALYYWLLDESGTANVSKQYLQ